MIINIILLILIILLLALIITFSFYIFLPSIHKNEGKFFSDPIVVEQKNALMMKEKDEIEKSLKKAVVLCSCNKEFSLKRTKFNEDFSCFMTKSNFGTGFDCKFGCIGLGDCVKVCPQKAIEIVNHTAVVLKNCCGCGKCENVCPQKIIKLVPSDLQSTIICSNQNIQDFTTCSQKQKEEKIERSIKKHFKIWEFYYKIIKSK